MHFIEGSHLHQNYKALKTAVSSLIREMESGETECNAL
jgi:hypothetical protein